MAKRVSKTSSSASKTAFIRPPATPVSVPASTPPKPVAATVAMPAPVAKAAPAKASLTISHGQIAKRAYEIWERRGRPTGRDVENWKEAERELTAELGTR